MESLRSIARSTFKKLPRWLVRPFTICMTRGVIWEWIDENKPSTILEMGLGDGMNAKKVIELAENCEYYCFDNLGQNRSLEPFNELQQKTNVHFYIGDTKQSFPKYIDDLPEMDLIFIDGGHDYETVKNDWEYCQRLMHRDSVGFFDDYEPAYPDVKRVVDGIGEEFSKEIIEPFAGPKVAKIGGK